MLFILDILKPLGRLLLNPYVIIAIVLGALAWYGHSKWTDMQEQLTQQTEQITKLDTENKDNKAKIVSLETSAFESKLANDRLEQKIKDNALKLANFRTAVKNAQSPAELEALYVERYNMVLDCLQEAASCSDTTNTPSS